MNPTIITPHRTLFLFSFAFLALGVSQGEVSPSQAPTLDADQFFFDEKTQVVRATGDALLQSESFILSADQIHWDKKESTAEARGRAIFNGAELRVLAERIFINLKTGDLEAEHLKTGFYPWVLQAEGLSGKKLDYDSNNTKITLSDAELFFREQNQIEPSLVVETINLDMNNSDFKAQSIGIRLGNRTFLKIPNLRGDFDQKNLAYSFRAGKKSSLGWYAGVRRTWQFSKNSESSLSGSFFPERGLYLSPRANGSDRSESEIFYDFSVHMGGIIDQGNNRGTDQLGQAIAQDRGHIHLNAQKRISENWRLIGQLFSNSDSEVYRDFQSEQFSLDQWRQNFGELSYEGSTYSISALTQWQQNDYESMVTQTPNLRIDAGPTSLFDSRVMQSIAIEYADFKSKTSHGVTTAESAKLDFGYKLQRRFSMPLGLSYIPSLAYRIQSYDLENQSNSQRQFGEWGNELHLYFHGNYEINNEVWEIDQVRHFSGLSLKHRRRTLLEQELLSNIPVLDHPFSDLNLSPMDLLDHIEADDLQPSEALRLEWTNHLIGTYQGSARELLCLSLFQDLWVNDRLEDTNPHFYGEVELHPAPWLSLEGQSKIDVNAGKSLKHNLTCRIRDGRVNDLRVSYFKRQSFGEEWQIFLNHRLNSRKTLAMGIRFDGESSKIPYWMGAIRFRPKGNWMLGITISQRQGTAKEDEMEVRMNANLFSF